MASPDRSDPHPAGEQPGEQQRQEHLDLLLDALQTEVDLKRALVRVLPAAWQQYLLPVTAQLDQFAAAVHEARRGLSTYPVPPD